MAFPTRKTTTNRTTTERKAKQVKARKFLGYMNLYLKSDDDVIKISNPVSLLWNEKNDEPTRAKDMLKFDLMQYAKESKDSKFNIPVEVESVKLSNSIEGSYGAWINLFFSDTEGEIYELSLGLSRKRKDHLELIQALEDLGEEEFTTKLVDSFTEIPALQIVFVDENKSSSAKEYKRPKF